MEKHNIIVLSTVHVTSKVMQTLVKDSNIMQSEYGVLLSYFTLSIYIKEPCISAIANFANLHGCEFVMLDRDGLVEEALPTYEW